MARAKNTELRKQILRTAYAQFKENGYKDTLMKNIAKECGIKPALLQHYFSKKEDILIHILYNVIFLTIEYMEENNNIWKTSQKKLAVYIWTDMFWRLYFEYLVKDNNCMLDLYTVILYNSKLLQKCINITNEKFWNKKKFLCTDEDLWQPVPGSYILQGTLSQLVALYWRNNTLIIPKETIINLAMSVYLRYERLEEQEEQKIFAIVDDWLTNEVISDYIQYCEKYISDFEQVI